MKNVKYSNKEEREKVLKKGELKCWECLNNPVEVLYVQCGHAVVCNQCLDKKAYCRMCGEYTTKVTFPLDGKYNY